MKSLDDVVIEAANLVLNSMNAMKPDDTSIADLSKGLDSIVAAHKELSKDGKSSPSASFNDLKDRIKNAEGGNGE